MRHLLLFRIAGQIGLLFLAFTTAVFGQTIERSKSVNASSSPLIGAPRYLVNQYYTGQLLWTPSYCSVNQKGLITNWDQISAGTDTIFKLKLSYWNDSIPKSYEETYPLNALPFRITKNFDNWGRLTFNTVVDSFGLTSILQTNNWGAGYINKGIRYAPGPRVSSRVSDSLHKSRFWNLLGMVVEDTSVNFNRQMGYLVRSKIAYTFANPVLVKYAIVSKSMVANTAFIKNDSIVFNWVNDTLIINSFNVVPLANPSWRKRIKVHPAPTTYELFNQTLETTVEEELSQWLDLPGRRYYSNSSFFEEGETYIHKTINTWKTDPIDNSVYRITADSTFIQGFRSGRIDSLTSSSVFNTQFVPLVSGFSDQFDRKKVIAYPNPSTDFLSFKELEPNKKITLINLQGEKIADYHWQGSPINCRSLPSGMYFYQIEDKGSKSQMGKWIKE